MHTQTSGDRKETKIFLRKMSYVWSKQDFPKTEATGVPG